MNRILRIVIYGVILFLVYLWISSVAQSCSNKKDADQVKSEQQEPSELSDQEIYDEYFESDEEVVEDNVTDSERYDDYDYEEVITEGENEVGSEASTGLLDTEDFGDYEPAAEDQNPTRSNPGSETNSTLNENDGKYLVIAGSYLIKENAEKMISKLKGLGYPDASIINFELSQYHSITAGRYFSYERAAEIARAIQAKGIDCYVHTRK